MKNSQEKPASHNGTAGFCVGFLLGQTCFFSSVSREFRVDGEAFGVHHHQGVGFIVAFGYLNVMLKKQESQEADTVLKIFRDALGLTQQQLADILGVHRITIVRCETGQREITLTVTQFQRFCKLVNERLGAVALLHFVTGELVEFSSYNTDSVKNCINIGKK